MFILATEDQIALPEAGLDLVFARNVFHHLPEPGKFFAKLKRYLKIGGRVAIIEHKKKGFSFVSLFGHHTVPEEIVREMERAGYMTGASFDFLPDRTFTCLQRNNPLSLSQRFKKTVWVHSLLF